MQKRLDSCFEELEKNPLYGNNIRPLTGKLNGLYRCRIENWRVIYRIDKKHTIVEIIAILPRGDAYLA
ncbi:MAG: type II toxin-antitoxin system mRNA interferase toxin, RelE/StbE family [Nitrospirae bacterium]|nr:type II toxin-antitoxin system mRNA interferase toxin, RelE/StbE family [Nitrospirota bacterium]